MTVFTWMLVSTDATLQRICISICTWRSADTLLTTYSLRGMHSWSAIAACSVCMCKRGFGSPRIWIPHPKTLADLDDPKRGFGSPADLDPSIYFVYDRLENDDVECWEPNPRTPKRGFGSPADLDPDSQRIVEDLFRQVSMSLAHSDWQITFGEVITSTVVCFSNFANNVVARPHLAAESCRCLWLKVTDRLLLVK